MKIAAFEGFYGGSHRRWLEGYASRSAHDIRIWSLPDRFWKWRMHGGAITLATQFNEDLFEPDCLLVTDMLDLNVLLSLTRKRTASLPVVLYFHENQINYPWSSEDRDVEYQRDHHYGFINYASAVVADKVLFNSAYHMEAFLSALPRYLKMFPDYQNIWTINSVAAKSEVLPLGVDLASFDRYLEPRATRRPNILWNHRWEYDKDPETFFNIMIKLDEEGYDFGLIVCGERTEKYPEVFDSARQQLQHRIVHWGHATSLEAYARLLAQTDILPVTSNQDFFGISAVEAMYCGAYPLLPNRLAFPEHIPEHRRSHHLYEHPEQLLGMLRSLLNDGVPSTAANEWVRGYDWGEMVGRCDGVFGRVCE